MTGGVIRHRAIEIVRFWLCPAESPLSQRVVVATADVNDYFQEISSPPAQRRSSFHETSGAVQGGSLESEIQSQLIFNMEEISPGLEEDGQRVVEWWKVFGLRSVDCPAWLSQSHEMCIWTLRMHAHT